MKIEIPFSGHKNILSLHKKTIEITKDSKLSVSGDCIVGTNSTIACIDSARKIQKKDTKLRYNDCIYYCS